MTLAERLSEFVRAAFTGLWIQSFEHDDAIAEIARMCRQQGWSLAAWDIDRGLNLHGGAPTPARPSAPATRSRPCARWGRWSTRKVRRFLCSAISTSS